MDANQELASVVHTRRARRSISKDYAVVVVGGSTAAGVTVRLPWWCYELTVSFCGEIAAQGH